MNSAPRLTIHGATRRSLLKAACAAAAGSMLGACGRPAQSKRQRFKLAASVYVGWVPWMFAAESGQLRAAGEAFDIDLSLVRGSYVESIDQFMAGHVDAVVMTNIDALAVLPGSGVQADAILIGSYSHGNDALLMRSGAGTQVRGAKVGLVENSVSHYLLHRYLQTLAMPESAVEVFNVADADLARAFSAAGSQLDAVVTWNPIVGDLVQRTQARSIFSSAEVPKEIADMLVVRREVLDEHPALGRALLQAWFGAMQSLTSPDTRRPTLQALARLSDSSVEAYLGQLATTLLAQDRGVALQEMQSVSLLKTMTQVEDFVRRRNIIANAPEGAWYTVGDSARGALHFNTVPLLAAV